MTEEEIDCVAEELAKAGGTAWYAAREGSPLLRVLSERYRDRARIAIAALDRYRASKEAGAAGSLERRFFNADGAMASGRSHESLRVGSLVIYRPPGDQRAYSCRIERIEGDRAYLVPEIKSCTGWISLDSLRPRGPNEEAVRSSA